MEYSESFSEQSIYRWNHLRINCTPLSPIVVVCLPFFDKFISFIKKSRIFFQGVPFLRVFSLIHIFLPLSFSLFNSFLPFVVPFSSSSLPSSFIISVLLFASLFSYSSLPYSFLFSLFYPSLCLSSLLFNPSFLFSLLYPSLCLSSYRGYL